MSSNQSVAYILNISIHIQFNSNLPNVVIITQLDSYRQGLAMAKGLVDLGVICMSHFNFRSYLNPGSLIFLFGYFALNFNEMCIIGEETGSQKSRFLLQYVLCISFLYSTETQCCLSARNSFSQVRSKKGICKKIYCFQ
jgi:hypothetical protein